MFEVSKENGLVLTELWPGVSIQDVQVSTGCSFEVRAVIVIVVVVSLPYRKEISPQLVSDLKTSSWCCFRVALFSEGNLLGFKTSSLHSALILRLKKYRLPSTRIRRIRQRIRKKINPLSRVEKNKSATNPITCGRVNPDIFESDDVKSVSSLSPNNKPIWRHNVSDEQSKFPATISLYGACSEDILVQRSLGY